MLQSGWSWWEVVALGGVAWTMLSFLFALALARVLRANHDFRVDMNAAADAQEPAREPVTVIHLEPAFEGSLLAALMPAEISEEEDEDGVTRSSGTRFRPIEGASEHDKRKRKLG
jgi:hypothetical protein